MTKKTFFAIAFAFAVITATAQDKLNVKTFYLSNGLKVILCEEHSEPKIYGSIVVHAGSKNEDTAATGVAHYFEHIMFKGTDRIGTTNWEKEKPYLDSISDLYDIMQKTSDSKKRHDIQLEINRMNIEASKYAIANETDAILQQMGCTGLNAGTTYDYTVYYNTLPSNQLENWMEVYAERFRNPVYRLFQSELEAVYEERNLYANQMLYTFQRNIVKESFGEHPYSRDIIGWDRHLKNPQPSAMKRFYDKYYVASNMALVLVGGFDTDEAMRLAEKYFSIWPKGDIVKEPKWELPTFDKQVIKKVKQTPVKVGIMIFPGVKGNDPDELVLDMMSSLLTGGNGPLDELVTKGDLMAAQIMPLTLKDAGSNIVIYVPKLLGQKHEAAEELIWAALDSIKQGCFSDELLESIKTKQLVERKKSVETYRGIASLLQSLELTGSSYEEWLKDNERLKNMSRADIMAVTKKYFDRDHCTIVRSRMGFPKKDAAIKPDWDHLNAQNKGEQSPFAKHIAERTPSPINPQIVDFNKDVTILPVSEHCNLYATRNPKNDLFEINIYYHYGSADNHNIDVANNYFSNLGVKDSLNGHEFTLQQFNIELDKLGGSFSINTGYDYTSIKIGGLEKNRDEILNLALLKLRYPRHDSQQLDNLIEELQASKKAAKNEASIWTEALYDYVLYGDKSEYLDHTTVEELRNLKGNDLIGILNNIFGRDGYITYVGNSDPVEIVNQIRDQRLVKDDVTVIANERHRIPRSINNDAVYYCTNKKFLKSDIDFRITSTAFDYEKDRAACTMFNEYMSGSMAGIFFQEIREFRSLGYSTYGRFNYNRQNLFPAHYYGYLGTQCDKTNDGVAAVRDIMLVFPERKEKFESARDYLVATRNSNYITFRSLPAQVRYWKEVVNIDHDPRHEITEEILGLNFEDLRAFHKKYVEGRPMAIFITGNAKKIDMKDLSKYGEIKEVKFNDMIKF
ncbi:MAG: insulinase family protein [Bacteroidales bacterium]|nr:insulinase family protein [Bacteroidales bacterium]